MRLRPAIAIAATLAALMWAPAAGAATLQPVGTFESPVFVTSDPDDAGRLFVVEKGGTIRLVTGGGTTTFLDISALVRLTGGSERGLLSMAFAPDFEESGRYYVYYTSEPAGDIQVDEFTANGDDGNFASRRPVLTVPHRDAGNHNGGQLQFGPDGYLYMGTGDGGGGGDEFRNAQNLDSLLGKLLRIDPRPSGAVPYTVPPDNPFVGAAGADEIWSYGLRNPYRFSFDRETGALFIGDVGQGAREEVDYEPQPDAGRGDNFGWSCREGFIAYPTSDPLCAGASGFTDPIHAYPHEDGACSITGGYVARDPTLGDLVGRYVYSDFCTGEIRSLVPGLPLASGDRSEGLTVDGPSSFGEDARGRLYVASLNGPVYRFAAGPRAMIEAPKHQDIDGRIRLRVGVGGAATVAARMKTTRAGGSAIARGSRKKVELGAGESARVGWKLRKADRRRIRAALRDGDVTARFSARATDAAGNRGPKVRASSKLAR